MAITIALMVVFCTSSPTIFVASGNLSYLSICFRSTIDQAPNPPLALSCSKQYRNHISKLLSTLAPYLLTSQA